MLNPGTASEWKAFASLHSGANDPNEPYCGVAALFNADLHVADPGWAPRNHWRVVSDSEISLIGEEVLDAIGKNDNIVSVSPARSGMLD